MSHETGHPHRLQPHGLSGIDATLTHCTLHTLCVFDALSQEESSPFIFTPIQTLVIPVITAFVAPHSASHLVSSFPSLRLARQSATNNDVRISLDTELWLSDEAERAASFAQTIRRNVNLRCGGGGCVGGVGGWVGVGGS